MMKALWMILACLVAHTSFLSAADDDEPRKEKQINSCNCKKKKK